MNDHELRLQKEVEFYEDHHDRTHILNRWPLYSEKRNLSAYHSAKRVLMREAARRITEPTAVLVAPCGTWDDLPFLKSAWPSAKYTGIDIAPVANPPEQTHVGDIRQMPFESASFDVAFASLFFHHVADEGFWDYLREFRRVLRPGGFLITLEPSIFHPVFAITRPMIKLVGNITGQVPHEHPISLMRLAKQCRDVGFGQVETFGCNFTHNRTPVPLRSVVNTLCAPLRNAPGFKHAAWLVGLIARTQ